jgi:succinoglycan biosynthesis protein ExoO
MAPCETRVSVLIAAYNAEAHVHHAIASALAQSDIELEVIVVDDGSSDATAASVARRAQADSRIKLVRMARNCGPASARNAGIRMATGEWIAILDADDAYLPGRLAHLAELGQRSGADIVADAFLFFDPRSGLTRPALASSPAEEVLELKSLVARSRPYGKEADFGLLKPMLRREYMLRSGLSYPVEARHGEDFLLVFEALRQGASYVLSRKPFYLYTTQAGSRVKTAYEFERQIAQTADLRGRQGVAEDEALIALLDLRCRALKRQKSEASFLSIRGNLDATVEIRVAELDFEPGVTCRHSGDSWLQ